MRHSNHSQARRALGSRRPHSNCVSTSACDTRLNCIVVMSHILVWHYPPLVRSQRSNRVRHSSDSQARRALGSRRPHSNRVSTSACDTRLNCIVLMSHILVWHYPPLVRSQHSNRLYWAQVYLSLSCVFACVTPHNIAKDFLVPRAFQKYSTCMVYSDFPIPGKNPSLEGVYELVIRLNMTNLSQFFFAK